MIDNIAKDRKFGALMKRHIFDVLEHILAENIPFSIFSNLAHINFEPTLPSHIISNFKMPIVLFALNDYTLESAILSKDYLKFVASFGDENFESVVSIPLGAIVHIYVDEIPILVNITTFEPILKTELDKQKLQNSKNIFLSNPKNKGIFRK